jgi:HJR/Mrr/RecB family endonuclease
MSNNVGFKDWKARAKTEKETRKQEELNIRRQEELSKKEHFYNGKVDVDKYLQKISKKKLGEDELAIRKIGLLIDLCCDLIPDPIYLKIIEDELLIGGSVSNCYISSGSIKIPRWVIENYKLFRVPMDSTILSDGYVTPTLKEYEGFIKKHIKQNCYTAALIETIYFLLASRDKNYKVNDLHIIGDLLIDMGAISGALRLYAIDERTFNDPNKLSLLAHNAIKAGYLEYSTKLIKKLIDQEPYHPSITIIQVEIKRLEQRHILSSKLSIDFSKVEELSGIEFENLLLDKFVSLGFKVEPTPKTGDYGADLIVENNDGSRIIFQCKRFKSRVNLKAVQEVVGAMGHYAGDYGVVITNNTFLNSAVKLAESHDIELWDGDKLISFLAGDLSFSEILS